jgi:hypothetical protein
LEKKIIPSQDEWLLGPFGQTKGIGQKFIQQLIENEHLVIDNSRKKKGLLQSVSQLNLTEKELNRLSKDWYISNQSSKGSCCKILSCNQMIKTPPRWLSLIFP